MVEQNKRDHDAPPVGKDAVVLPVITVRNDRAEQCNTHAPVDLSFRRNLVEHT